MWCCVAGGQVLPGGRVADEAAGKPPHGSHQGRSSQHEVGDAGEFV